MLFYANYITIVNFAYLTIFTDITQKVLTSHLRSMEAAGLVTRTVYPEVPPKVEYSFTDTGISLKPILDAMLSWGTTYKENNA